MRMKLLGACATAMLVGGVASAQATTITLAGDGKPFKDDQEISAVAPAYGSFGNVAVNWNPLSDPVKSIKYYSSTYSGGAAGYCGTSIETSGNCSIDLTATLGGMTVTLSSFFLVAVPEPVANPPESRAVAYSVTDLATNKVIMSDLAAPVSVTNGLKITVDATSATGFRIAFGPDGYNGGINDIVYTQTEPVPEPASLAILGAAVAGLAALRRRRAA